MSYGLYDADLSKYIHVPFNLELMKLSSYWKGKGQLVTLAPVLEPNLYQHFIYRKDYSDGEFPLTIVQSPNVEFGGYSFHPKIYNPLDLDIEKQKADKFLYSRVEKDFKTNTTYSKNFVSMSNANHLRLSLDNKTVWKDFSSQVDLDSPIKALFFHDYNLNDIDNSYEIIKDFLNELPYRRQLRRIGTKFPIQIHEENNLVKWTILPTMNSYYPIQYNGILSDEAFCSFVERKARTNTFSQFKYNISYNTTYEEFIDKGIIQLYYQLTFARNHLQTILFVYDENFFKEQQWENLIIFLNYYSRHLSSDKMYFGEEGLKECSLYSYALMLSKKVWEQRYRTHAFRIDEVREIFDFIKHNNYELFKMFYECHDCALTGGKLQPC